MRRGFYIDPSTGSSRPIASAMNEGLIKVEAVTETVSKQKKEEMGEQMEFVFKKKGFGVGDYFGLIWMSG